jgi:hypothetical protein
MLDESIIQSIIDQYHNTATFYQASQIEGGVHVMKYSMGLAVLYSPFFFIAHLLAPLLGYAQDGFSAPYQYAIFLGGILYTLLGLWFLAKVLRHFFTNGITTLTLIIIVFGTNYLLHTSMYGQNAMSHNHLFLAYSLIIWLTIQWHNTRKTATILMLGVVCGLSILSRPSEIVCLFIPLFWGITDRTSFSEKLIFLLRHKKQLVVFATVILFIGLPQLIYWKMYTGHWLYNSYGANAGEGFEFLHPYFSEVLFSFRKGWLVYTPVMMFGIAGFYFIRKYNPPIFASLTLYFVLNLYIVSSWSCWWYAQSFSQRAFIPSYPIMAIALGYFLVWISEKRKSYRIITSVILFALITLNIFQTVQYDRGILHGDRMTRDYYFATFGKLHTSTEEQKLLLIDRSFDGQEEFRDSSNYTLVLREKMDFNTVGQSSNHVIHADSSTYRLDSLTFYSPGFERAFEQLTHKDHAWIRISASVYAREAPSANPFCIVTHLTHNGYAYKYKAFEPADNDVVLNEWSTIQFDYLTPEIRRPGDPLKIYVWLMGKSELWINNLEFELYEHK